MSLVPNEKQGRDLRITRDGSTDSVTVKYWEAPPPAAQGMALASTSSAEGGGAHSTFPVSSASMIICSSQTICQAISCAVRDFGSGR